MTHRKQVNEDEVPFWKRVPLERMTRAQWESLCDGCGRCCLEKLEDEDTGALYFTDIACRLLDGRNCRCRSYADRHDYVPDCVKLTPGQVRHLTWLPPTCAYRLIAEGKDLYWWHPLVSGSPRTVHDAGVSVRGRIGAREDKLPVGEWDSRIVRWPGQVPAGARRRSAPGGTR